MSTIDDPTNPYDGASPNDPGIAWVNANGPKLFGAAWALFCWPSPVAILAWGLNPVEFGDGFVAWFFESLIGLAFWVSFALWVSAFYAFRRETIGMFLVKRDVKQLSPALAPPMTLLGDMGQTRANKPVDWAKVVGAVIGFIPSALAFLWRWRAAIAVLIVLLVGWRLVTWIEGLNPFRPSRDSLERTIDSLETGLATERVRANVAIPAIEEPQTFRRNTDRIREEYDAGNERLEAARHAERLDYLRAWRDADRELRDAAVTQAG